MIRIKNKSSRQGLELLFLNNWTSKTGLALLYFSSMLSFLQKKQVNQVGIILDVSSGSVAVAIVTSNMTQKYPEILWSHREYITKSEADSSAEKQLHSALLNTFLILDSEGMKILRDKMPEHKPVLIQVSLGSPFSYTINRTVNISSPTPFKIKPKLIEKLEAKALKEIKQQLSPEVFSKATKLNILAETTVDLKFNGYHLRPPFSGSAQEATLSQLVSLSTNNLTEVIKDNCNKILAGVPIDFDSFSSLYSRAFRHLTDASIEAGLISVTARSIEMSILRNGVPGTVSFTNKGHHSLAEDIAKAASISFEEALSIMRNNGIDHTKAMPQIKLDQITNIEKDFTEVLKALFKKLGGSLSIPKKLYVHIDPDVQDFFLQRLDKASTLATGIKHKIYAFTPNYFTFGEGHDSRLLCSAYVFHYKLYREEFAEQMFLV